MSGIEMARLCFFCRKRISAGVAEVEDPDGEVIEVDCCKPCAETPGDYIYSEYFIQDEEGNIIG